MKLKSVTSDVIARSSRHLLVLLAAFSALLMPAAVAWACTPLAQIGTDKRSYRPGEQMTVSGNLFRPAARITLTTDPPGASASTTSTPFGTFRTTLAAPSGPGPYVLLATSSAGVARTTFIVTPAEPRPPARPPLTAQCADGQDNDRDAKTYFPADPGFSAAADDDESDPPPPPAPSRTNTCTKRGTAGNDVIRGTSSDDFICAGAGNDVVYGAGGNDTILGQGGNDALRGQEGNDRLLGGPGNDSLVGGSGNDSLSGSSGNDSLVGGPGNDSCRADRRDARRSC